MKDVIPVYEKTERYLLLNDILEQIEIFRYNDRKCLDVMKNVMLPLLLILSNYNDGNRWV